MDEWKRTKFARGNLIELFLLVAIFSFAVLLPNKSNVAGVLSGIFMPLGVTLGIWGIVYALLMVCCAYIFIPSVRRHAERGVFIERIGYLFLLACILNIGWMFALYYKLTLFAAGASFLLLLTLAGIYMRLKIGNARAGRAETYLVQVPFRIYLGWAVIITLASTAAALGGLQWDGFGLGPQIWILFGILIAVTAAVVMLVKRGDVWFSLVIAAALLGLFLDRLFGGGVSEQILVTIAGMGAVMVAGAILYLMASGYRRDANRLKFRT